MVNGLLQYCSILGQILQTSNHWREWFLSLRYQFSQKKTQKVASQHLIAANLCSDWSQKNKLHQIDTSGEGVNCKSLKIVDYVMARLQFSLPYQLPKRWKNRSRQESRKAKYWLQNVLWSKNLENSKKVLVFEISTTVYIFFWPKKAH